MSKSFYVWSLSAALMGSALPPAIGRGQEAALLPPQGQVPPAAQVPAQPDAAAAAQAAAPAADAMQVLEQGPVHEAYAEPVVLEAAKLIQVDRAPPEPVNELPPEVKPEGNNVQWISGYWMWSEPQNDFIWVSGVWRDMPPGRRWVPGHWGKAEAGFAWVPGFWAGEAQQEVQLLPTPPETLEVGPSSPAPGDNYFWIPGVWVWQSGGYGWRAGYWYTGQENWVYVPDHYCYTNSGAYFVNGYWDYPLANRGLLYAPVYWSRPIYSQAGYYYRPRSVINTALLLTGLFVNPYHSHYYYGYGSGYGRYGNFYRPWWQYGGGRGGYDPFYAYHRWHDGHNHNNWNDQVRQDWNRHHADWDRNRGDWDHNRADGRGRAGGVDGNVNVNVNNNQLVRNINEFRRDNSNVRLRDISQDEVRTAVQRSQNWQQIRDSRIAAETTAGVDGRANRGGGNVNGNLAGRRGRDGADVGADANATGQVGSNQPGRGRGRDGANPGGNVDAGVAAGNQVGATGEGQDRRLRVDTPEGTPRGSFRLPPVERSASTKVQGQANAGGANAGVDAAAQARANAARVWQNNRVGGQSNGARDGNVSRGRQFTPPATGQAGAGGAAAATGAAAVEQRRQEIQVGRPQFDRGSGSQFQPRVNYGQDGNVRVQGSGGSSTSGNVTIPGVGRSQPSTASPGSGFRSNAAGGGQPAYRGSQQSFRIPSDGGQRSVPSSGGGQRSFSVPSSGGASRTLSAPSGGSPRTFSAPPSGGGGGRSFSAPSGGSRPQGGSGGGQFRGNSGGGGGGNSAFRGNSGGGGGGESRGGGGGGNRGGGGGGGGGNGRGRK